MMSLHQTQVIAINGFINLKHAVSKIHLLISSIFQWDLGKEGRCFTLLEKEPVKRCVCVHVCMYVFIIYPFNCLIKEKQNHSSTEILLSIVSNVPL